MNEMDDSIGAYLSELKDENERLIQRLAERDRSRSKQVRLSCSQKSVAVRRSRPENACQHA